MKKLFELLIHGCWHHWIETERYDITEYDGYVIGKAIFCTCSKCGRPNVFNLYSDNE